jgi:hypothetical protein
MAANLPRGRIGGLLPSFCHFETLPRVLDPVMCLSDWTTYERYHESLDDVTPADVYFGRQHEIISERDKIKKCTMQMRKREYLATKAA